MDKAMDSLSAPANKRRSVRIGQVLHALFALMLVLITGVLLMPLYRDIQQHNERQIAAGNTRAARAELAALQAVRVKRGPTRTTLERTEPASAEFIALTADLRASSEPALATVMRECSVLDCVGSKKDTFTGLS